MPGREDVPALRQGGGTGQGTGRSGKWGGMFPFRIKSGMTGSICMEPPVFICPAVFRDLRFHQVEIYHLRRICHGSLKSTDRPIVREK